jgi:mannose-1-phosphate guanylyltransferase
MQALILAGGEGTRLRPLTTTIPKPVVPLVDRPFIAFMLEWLRRHDVDDVVMSCGFLASGVRNVLGDGSAYGMRIRYVEEPRPMGTGGALKFAESLLDDRFLMLNGDVLTDFDISAQIEQHERTGAVATLALTPVEDPSNYGLVRLAEDSQVSEFVEKPSPDQIDTRNISAGCYVLEHSVLEMLEPDRPASIERDVFPRLVGQGLYGHVADGYWLDIGTPERYLEGTFDILEGAVYTEVQERVGEHYLYVAVDVANDGRVVPPALVEHGSQIASDARVGARVVLESGVMVGEGTVIESSVVLQGAEIGANCVLRGCIVGGGVRIGDNCHIEDNAVLGEGVTVGADNMIMHGARIFPGVSLPEGAIRFRWTSRSASRSTTRCGSSNRPVCGVRTPPAWWWPEWAARRSAGGSRPPRWAIAHGGRSSWRPDTRCHRGSTGRGPCCAPPTRATRRRRSPATRTPGAAARLASWPPPADRWPSRRAPTASRSSRAPAAFSRVRRSATRSSPRWRRRPRAAWGRRCAPSWRRPPAPSRRSCPASLRRR